MRAYHDREWGNPRHSDRVLFEFLILEGMQAGLSWDTILRKRNNFRRAFSRFDPRRVARYASGDIRRLMTDAGIIRNRAKILAAIANARAFLEVVGEFGSFNRYIWGFVDGRPLLNRRRTLAPDPRGKPGLRGHERRPAAPWVSLRGPDHLLRVHAGRGHGERPYRRVLPPRPTPESYPTTYATYTNYTIYTITCKDLTSCPADCAPDLVVCVDCVGYVGCVD